MCDPSGPVWLTRDNMYTHMWSIYGILSPDIYVWADQYVDSTDTPHYEPVFGRLGQDPIFKWNRDNATLFCLEIPSLSLTGTVDYVNRLVYGPEPNH